MKVPYSYLTQQFDPDKPLARAIFKDMRRLFADGDFTLGWPVRRFEEAFQGKFRVKHAIGVSNGTDALFLSLKALGFDNPREWVVSVPNSFIATAGAILQAGANVRLVDVKSDYLIDKQQAHLSPARCAIGIDLTGNPVRWDPSDAWLEGKRYIRDAAQAIGAEIDGVSIANLGDAVCFSLHPLKNLNVAGDGGMVTTNNDAVAERVRLLRNHGLADRDTVTVPGFNHRLASLQAIVAYQQMMWEGTDGFDWVTERRIANAAFYDDALKTCLMVSIPPRDPRVKAVYHTYVIRVQRRDELQQYLATRGIETKIHYPRPIHLQPGYAHLGYSPGDFPETERQAQEIVSLPIHQYLSLEQIEFVAEQIGRFYGGP